MLTRDDPIRPSRSWGTLQPAPPHNNSGGDFHHPQPWHHNSVENSNTQLSHPGSMPYDGNRGPVAQDGSSTFARQRFDHTSVVPITTQSREHEVGHLCLEQTSPNRQTNRSSQKKSRAKPSRDYSSSSNNNSNYSDSDSASSEERADRRTHKKSLWTQHHQKCPPLMGKGRPGKHLKSSFENTRVSISGACRLD